ncbi:TonB-dependent receptor domain-containing protein [Roseovarius indicus]|uniref:Brucella heme uptake protein A n=1 Tax=Roseovarius indicus TaxID=540747 RepID=A0A0T5PAU0_9RHOB|nr:TonB-dependent receptor [Roseovarius indicus]KRS18205.1 TonB-dependent receptor [Roseovarius indicus]QEW26964.1 Brucella heme uptake protein A [Roseovarius indicus]SFD56918.1 hemoglobin/transferrin/lactoferrin receptor protein [Roseovarius indicus]
MKTYGWILTGAVAATGAAQAQEADPYFLGTLRIESSAAQALLGNEEIDEEDLDNRNAATTKDVFAGESSITASGGAAIAQKVYVNGIEESLLSITIDGARQNKSAFHHTGNVLLDPALLKRVEVSEGIAPADAGPGALAGRIAYETKDAGDLLEEGDTFGGMTSTTVGTNGDSARGNLTLFGRQGGFEYLLSATRHKSSDYDDGAGVRVPGTEADLTDYILKLAYEADSGSRLEFSASQTEDTGTRSAQAGPGGILFTRPDFAAVVGRPSVFVDALSKRMSYTLTYTDEKPEGWFDPMIQLSYNEQEIDASGVWGVNESLSGIVQNEWQIGNGTLTAGLDFFHETAKGRGRGPGPFGSSGKEELTNLGLFAQARQDVTDRVSVSYGARVDTQEFKAATGQTFEETGVSVNGAVDVILSDRWTLNAGVASSFGGYELGEAALINFGGAWNYAGFTTSRANAARIGLRYESGPWEASGAIFYTEVNDINAVLPTGGARGAQSDLVSQGFDGSLGYYGSKGFFRANYTYADVELNNAAIGSTAYYFGRPMGHIIGLEAAYDLNPHLRIGGTAEIALDNHDTPVKLSGYEAVDLYAAYTPKSMQNVEFRLDVRNVFDETYASRSSDGVGLPNVVALNEPGQSFELTAKIKF